MDHTDLTAGSVADLKDAANADRGGDVYQQLLKERIVFLGSEVNQLTANAICAQLLLLAAEDADRDVSFIINS
ncbi:MAG: ATP-dependent Clp protease proteolytic subunit, partial [Gammaproteobacteria bacterium]|nr:ATP-dependent Clp protease proteolytic subunit [Gammaproteobacteria bacterium]